MADSWNWPALINKIAQDVPFLQRALNALLKQDPTSIKDAPSGAKRLYEVSSGKWQWQEYNGSSWAAVPFLQHNVDQLDGYHAAITPAASTIAVRNADKKLEGDITGNAATSTSAATLSQTLPVNKGGTGATTSEQARTNLGVPPTSHASSNTTYGLATDANYGHVRSDGDTTNIVAGEVVVKDVAIGGDISDLARDRGQIGGGKYLDGTKVNIDEVVKHGRYRIYNTKGTSKGTWPQNSSNNNYIVIVDGQGSLFSQKFTNEAGEIFVRTKKDTTPWGEFNTFVRKADIVDVVRTDDIADVVRTSGIQTITGEKTFTTTPYVQGISPYWPTVETDYDRLATPAVNQESFIVVALDKNKKRVAALHKQLLTSGITRCSIVTYKHGVTDNTFATISSCIDRDGKKWGEAPTPSADSNTNHIATTAWVRDYAPLASTTKAGLVKIGEGLSIGSDGTLKANSFPTPDWAAKQARSFYTSYTATEDGYLFINMCASNYTDGFDVTVGNLTFTMVGKENYGWTTDTVCIPIKKGTTYSTSKVGDYDPGESKMYFMPVAN